MPDAGAGQAAGAEASDRRGTGQPRCGPHRELPRKPLHELFHEALREPLAPVQDWSAAQADMNASASRAISASGLPGL